MKVTLDREAEIELQRQLDYLIDRGASRAAQQLLDRVHAFLSGTLASHPRIGQRVGHRDLWETWIPGTRLVVWYRFSEAELQIVRIWHAAQDRSQRG